MLDNNPNSHNLIPTRTEPIETIEELLQKAGFFDTPEMQRAEPTRLPAAFALGFVEVRNRKIDVKGGGQDCQPHAN